MILVAHPDDETIGLGAQLSRFDDALLVHITDGAPRDAEDAHNYGFAEVVDYAVARQAELAAALRQGDATRLRRLGLGIPDKEAWQNLTGMALCAADLVRAEEPAAIFTHSYEGGHPDHDAAAFAVHTACRLVNAPPAIVEMPFYHRRDGRLVTDEFLANSLTLSSGKPGSIRQTREQSIDETAPAHAIEIAGEALDRKRRMVDCFTTQRWLLEQFDLSTERFRIAPAYDFRQPPHLGEPHYETLGWGITGADWRREAADALDRLGLTHPHRNEHSGAAISSGRETAPDHSK